MTTVVLATTGSDACLRAVPRLAEVFDGADVVVATAVPGATPLEDTGVTALRATLDELAVEEAAGLLARTCAAVGPTARPALLRGDPVEALCDLAAREAADAIVVGSLGARARWRTVGSTLVRRAPCPVLELGGEVAPLSGAG